jgi:hypothetical protein
MSAATKLHDAKPKLVALISRHAPQNCDSLIFCVGVELGFNTNTYFRPPAPKQLTETNSVVEEIKNDLINCRILIVVVRAFSDVANPDEWLLQAINKTSYLNPAAHILIYAFTRDGQTGNGLGRLACELVSSLEDLEVTLRTTLIKFRGD